MSTATKRPSSIAAAPASNVADIAGYLTVREVSLLLRVDHKTIRAAIADGRIPIVRLGRVIRIHRRVLDTLATQARVAMPDGKPHGRST